MKIKADGRGRIALAQAGIGKPHQEWEVTKTEGGARLTAVGETPSKEVGYYRLEPWMIGKVVRVTGVWHGSNREKVSGLPQVPEAGVEPSVVGTVEAYSTLDESKWLKLRGYTGLISLEREQNYGNSYGTGIYFWVQQ